MNDPRTEAPQLDLTSVVDEDGEDALQATLSDSVAGVTLDSAFSIEPPALKPAAAVPPLAAESLKTQRPGVKLADERFLAAFVGAAPEEKKKSSKSKGSKAAKAVAAPVSKPAMAEPAIAAAEPAALVTPLPEPVPVPVPATIQIAAPKIELSSVKPAVIETAIVAAGDPEKIAALVAGAVVVERRRERRAVTRTPAPLTATEPVTVWEPEIPPQPQNHVAASAPVAASLEKAVTVEKTANAPEIAVPEIAAPVAKTIAMNFVPMPAPASGSIVTANALKTADTSPAAAPVFAPPFTIAPRPSADAAPGAMPTAPAAVASKAIAPVAGKASPVPRIELPVESQSRAATGAWWTLPLMFIGLAMIACALIVPVADENHRSAYELAKIERDVAHFQSQSDVNQSFLARVSTDPALAERLAMRQLNMIRPDEKFAALKARHDAFSMSPFALVSVDPPAPMPAYHPIGGFLSRWFLSPRCQIYFVGLGLLLTAAGVVFGGGGNRDAVRQADAAATQSP